MAGTRRSDNWGFPRWRPYGSSRDAVKLRICDRDGCTAPGDRPAPKRPNSPERWYFCETHDGEYNRNWDYLKLDAETAAARELTRRRGPRLSARPSIGSGGSRRRYSKPR